MQKLKKSKFDLTVGMAFDLGIWSPPSYGITAGFTLSDRYLINTNLLKRTYEGPSHNDLGEIIQYRQDAYTGSLGMNYIFQDFEDYFRFVLGGSVTYTHFKLMEKQGNSEWASIRQGIVNEDFEINTGVDMKLTENFKATFVMQTSIIELVDDFRLYPVWMSIGLKYRILEKTYFKKTKKIVPNKIRNIQIY